MTDIVTSCGCDPLRAPDPVVDNLPAQPVAELARGAP